MFFKKKPKQLEKVIEINVQNMKPYYNNIASIGIPTKEYESKDVNAFGQNYYKYSFKHVNITFSKPKKRHPILVLANNLPIGEIGLMDKEYISQYITRPHVIDFYFSGGDYYRIDLKGKGEHGFYPYYCNITLTLL